MTVLTRQENSAIQSNAQKAQRCSFITSNGVKDHLQMAKPAKQYFANRRICCYSNVKSNQRLKEAKPNGAAPRRTPAQIGGEEFRAAQAGRLQGQGGDCDIVIEPNTAGADIVASRRLETRARARSEAAGHLAAQSRRRPQTGRPRQAAAEKAHPARCVEMAQ